MIKPRATQITPPLPSRAVAGQEGFAIIISITLLSFLVLLLLSLVLLTRVGTQVSVNGLQDAQARQNALVAVQIALGQLEKYAGPDQRTTAPAEFGNFSAGANGNATITPFTPTSTTGVVTPVAGARWWTGVWANSDPAGAIFSRTPVPKLLAWLVSGNEGAVAATFSPYGQLTTSPTMAFTPTQAVANLSTSTLAALNTNVTVNGKPAVQLVGANTATSSGALSVVDSYVAAPLVSLSVSAGLLPGFSGTASKVNGRYAYVVLDEGVKAKVNVRDPYDNLNTLSGTTVTSSYARVRVQAAQRNGIELVNGFVDAASPAAGSIAYPDNTSSLQAATLSSNIEKVLTVPQVRFLDPSATSAVTDAVIKQNFHNLTANSYGVIADSQRGGLRKDLTAYFEDNALFTNATDTAATGRKLAGKNILPDSGESSRNLLDLSMQDPALASITPDPRNISPKNFGPQWDLLKNFYGLSGSTSSTFLTPASSASVSVQVGDATHMPVIPVITQGRVYNKAVASGGKLFFQSQVAFAVANPYSVTLNIPNGLEFIWVDGGYGANFESSPGGQRDMGVVVAGGSFSEFSGISRSGNGGTNYPMSNLHLVANGQELKPNSLLSGYGQTGGTPNPYGTGPTADNVNPSVVGSATFYTGSFSLSPGQVQMLVISGNGQTSSSVLAVAPAGSGPQILMVPSGPSGVGSINDIRNNYFTYATNANISDGTHQLSQADGSSFSIYMKDRKTHQVLQALLNSDRADYDTNFGTNANFNLKNGDSITVAGGNSEPGNAGGLFLLGTMPGATIFVDANGGGVAPWGGPNPGDGQGSYRVFADFNWAAKYRVTPWVSTGWVGLAHIPPFRNFYLDNSTTGATGYQAFTSDAFPAVWGRNTSGTTMSAVLFDLPRRNSLNEMPVLSIGALQHASLTSDDQYPFTGFQPGNAVGNSWFHPMVTRTATVQARPNVYFAGAPDPASSVANTNYYDMAYLLNAALWDRYYFSAIPQVVAGPGVSANPRLKFAAGYAPTAQQLGLTTGATGTDSTGLALPKEYAAARYLMIDGAFNINSTSIEAWKAVLASLRKRNATVYETTGATTTSTPFPRSLYEPVLNIDPITGKNAAAADNAASYGGFRRLTDAQITTLATCIVQEVRLRGPFVSLAHFINRTGITGATGSVWTATQHNTVEVAGALQMAIDRAGLNTSSMSSGIPDEIAWTGHANNNGGSVSTFADILPAVTITKSETTAPGTGVTLNKSTGIPGWLTQADVLQALGPALAARSDTFVIRAYGDALDPVNTNPNVIVAANIQARAWCEAVVQRFPDYVDASNPASVDPNGAAVTAGTATTISAINQKFGRKFRIVSFRWLSPSDI